MLSEFHRSLPKMCKVWNRGERSQKDKWGPHWWLSEDLPEIYQLQNIRWEVAQFARY